MPTTGAAIATYFGASAATAATVGTVAAVGSAALTAYSAYSILSAESPNFGGQGGQGGQLPGTPGLNDKPNVTEDARRRRVSSSRLLQNPTGGLGDVSAPSLAVKSLLGA